MAAELGMEDEKQTDARMVELEYANTKESTSAGPIARPEGKIYLTTSAAQVDGIKFAPDGHTILVPQPSDDPNDPLNWSFFKKHMLLIISSMSSFLPEYGSATGAVTLLSQAQQWHLTPDHVNHSQAGNVFMLGVGGLFSVVCSAYFGRLPVLFWMLCLAFGTAIWCAAAVTFESFMAARILNGFFSAVTQSMTTVLINDMFFFHEKARKIGIWASFVVLAPSLGPMLGAFMLNTQRWPVPFWVLSSLTGLCLVLVIIFGEETYYDRRLTLEEQPARRSRLLRLVGVEQFHSRRLRNTVRETLRRPARVIMLPTVFISVIYAGITFAWQVGINTTSAIFLTPLYHFDILQVGYFYFAPAIGAILGEAAGYFAHDLIAKHYEKTHNGYFHPEARLRGAWLATPFLVSGLVLIGYAFQDHLHYMVVAVGWALFNMGAMISIVSINAYCLDSFPEASGEGAAWLSVGRTVGGFIISYEQVSWATKEGTKASFGIQAGLCTFGLVLAVFLQIYGQRLRKWSGSLKFKTI
ncbi:putative MFS-type transporter [Fonsecaea erecta]|uniref:Putative MFS-type transporter n=1 Tax=Fonsecaea erecta TaxID=1367422 RepID=A0A178Z9H5_9EURO|nr:putative MFS-type transporter [Fonsecaea erecta]OAP56444.1 putative MFS-type transporter [Fonsecaea erecta]